MQLLLFENLFFEFFIIRNIDLISIDDIMINNDYRTKRLSRTEARKKVTEVVNRYPSHIRYSKHALEELQNDNLTTSDVLNIIKSSDAKILKEPDFEKGSYRYRLETKRITVVVAFDSPTSFVVVTAWRNRI